MYRTRKCSAMPLIIKKLIGCISGRDKKKKLYKLILNKGLVFCSGKTNGSPRESTELLLKCLHRKGFIEYLTDVSISLPNWLLYNSVQPYSILFNPLTKGSNPLWRKTGSLIHHYRLRQLFRSPIEWLEDLSAKEHWDSIPEAVIKLSQPPPPSFSERLGRRIEESCSQTTFLFRVWRGGQESLAHICNMRRAVSGHEASTVNIPVGGAN